MEHRSVGISRPTVVLVVVLCALLLGIPSFGTGVLQVGLSPTDGVAAGAGNRVLTIGWVEFQSYIGTLNPLLYTMSAEQMAIWPCYSTLLMRDVEGNLTGDLVRSYAISGDGRTFDFELVPTARFYDRLSPATVHPVTSADVIFTYWLVQNTTGNVLQSYLTSADGVPLIEAMWNDTGDPYRMHIRLSSVYAPFPNSLSNIPILPKYLWQTMPWNWDNYQASGSRIAPVIGSGPFHYVMDGMPTIGVMELARSPTWFATEERGWQLRVSKVVVRSEASQLQSLNDYLSGVIDIMMYAWPSDLLNPTLPGSKFAVSGGFEYEYNLNQMTDSLRASLGSPYAHGTNNQLLLDPVVKQAIAMSVDKQAFVDEVLDGFGIVADSLVPANNPWHYWYGLQPGEDPQRVGRAPAGEEPIVYDPSGARGLLMANGWAFDQYGNPAGPATTPLCKAGGESKLQFRFWTLDSAPEWNEGATLLAEMAWAVGVDITSLYEVRNTAFMNSAWAAADYDMWLWNWMFSESSDVSADIMQVLTTDAIGSGSDIFWSDPEYDSTYAQSISVLDPSARMILADRLQRMAYENMGCQIVAYKDDLYAASGLGAEKWQGYGDWRNKSALVPDRLLPWLYMQMEPAQNPAPKLTFFPAHYDGTTVSPVSFIASVTDSQPLVYRWFFGDGTSTDWQPSSSTTHLYSDDGLYDAYFAAKENTAAGTDQFVTWSKATVSIAGANSAPRDVSFSVSPGNPYSGATVWLNGTATDDEGDPLTFAWDFGDGYFATGQNTYHEFMVGNQSYTVTLSVDDGHLGMEPRPVTYSRLIFVRQNSPPSCIVPDVLTSVSRSLGHFFVIEASDPDGDALKYTFDWGDGTSKTVSDIPLALHTYSTVGTRTMTVWADDLTGLAGHNVSDTGVVIVYAPLYHPPVLDYLTASSLNPVAGEEVTFTARATDPRGEVCQVTFDFGDGNASQVYQFSPNSTVSVTHVYSESGSYSVYAEAFDGGLYDLSELLNIEVWTADWTTFWLNLTAGWNMFSVPFPGYRASTLGLPTGDVIAGYGSPNQFYNRSYTVGVSPPFKDFWIFPTEGYWAFCSAAVTLVLQGPEPAGTYSRTINVPVAGGWFVFGLASLKTIYKASDVPSWYSGGSVYIVAWYDPIVKVYEVWTPGAPPFKDFYLLPGCGYWVYVTMSGVLNCPS